MADPIALLTHIIEVVLFIKRQHENSLMNHAECALLVGRVAALEPSLTALLQRPTAMSMQSLTNLQKVIDDIKKALDKFNEGTYWRRADRLANATKYLRQLINLQAHLAAVAGDLTLATTATLSEDLARLLNPALRREDDLGEARKWMESMMTSILAEMKAEKEADADAFKSLREEMQRGHEGLLAAVLEGGEHAPLAESELKKLQQQQQAFLDESEARFAEILDAMRLMQEEVHALHGDLGDIKAGLADVAKLALSSQQAERRAAALRALLRDSSEVTIISRLDAGGFGTIYLGIYQRDHVAIKIIEGKDRLGDPRDLSERERRDAENEALLMDRLKHPNVLAVLGLVLEARRATLILDLAPFGSLWATLSDTALFPFPFPASLQIAWLSDVCYGVSHLHSKLVRHKDLKCQNLLLYGGTGGAHRFRVKICDFGLAKQSSNSSGASSDAPTDRGGTGAFDAPEVWRREKRSSKSDVFSLAMTAVQLLTRTMPHKGSQEEQEVQIAAAVEVFRATLLSPPPVPAALHMPSGLTSPPLAPSAHTPHVADRAALAAATAASLYRLLLEAAAPLPVNRPSALSLFQRLDALLAALGGDCRHDAGSPDFEAVRALEAAAGSFAEQLLQRKRREGAAGGGSAAAALSLGAQGSNSGATTKDDSKQQHEDIEEREIEALSAWLHDCDLTVSQADKYARLLYKDHHVANQRALGRRMGREAGFLAKAGVAAEDAEEIEEGLQRGGLLAAAGRGRKEEEEKEKEMAAQAKKEAEERRAKEEREAAAAAERERARAAQAKKEAEERRAKEEREAAAAAAEKERERSAAQGKKAEEAGRAARERASRVAPAGTGRRIYDAAEEGDMAALRPLVQEWSGHDVLNWVDPDELFYEGYTPLIISSAKGMLEAVELLLATPGIDVNKADKDGKTATTYAASEGHTEIVRALLAAPGIDLNKADKDGRTALRIAIFNQEAEAASLMRAAGAKESEEDKVALVRLVGKRIFDAARDGDMAALRPLVQQWSGHDVLNWANPAEDEFWEGYTPLITSSQFGELEVVQLLLATPGIDVNKRLTGGYFKGKTALGLAIRYNEPEAAALLRAAGARE